jgi:hypothetical protein
LGTDTRRPPRAASKQRSERVLLIALSPTREKLLLEEPELVRAILLERAKTTIPRSVEFDERFQALQDALLDLAAKSGGGDGNAKALTPGSGELLYEDDTVRAARLLRAPQAHALAKWVAGVPRELSREVGVELGRLQAFYRELDSLGHSLLAVHFSE